MDRVWITNGSTTVPLVTNSLNAACREGYLPTDIYLLENPGIADVTDPTVSMMTRKTVRGRTWLPSPAYV